VLYFLRINPEDIPVSVDISNDVIMGQFGPHSIKSFSLILDQVYGKLLPGTKFPSEFSEDDRRGFFSQLSKFSMTMVDVVETIDCKVNFRRVDPGVMYRCSQLNGEKALEADLKHLEIEIAGQWLPAAMKELDIEDPTLHSIEDLGPEMPLKHWRGRAAHLNSLNEHFESADTGQVLQIWEQILPEKAESWNKLEKKLRECTQEANDNVKHLSNLTKYFEALYDGTPEKISEELLAIFSKVKMMRYLSKYLQKDECVTGLLVKIINQMIIRCKVYINSNDGGKAAAEAQAASTEVASPKFSGENPSKPAENFRPRRGSIFTPTAPVEAEKDESRDDVWSQDCGTLLSKMEQCIKLNHTCQLKYREAKHDTAIAATLQELHFQFDESQIFAKFVHFEQRLQKLIEFFKAYRLFGLLREKNDPGLETICNTFFTVADLLKNRPYDMLDITATTFDTEYESICLVVAELEQQLQEYIRKNFLYIESTDQALDLLSNMHALLQRDSLKPYLNAKYLAVFTNFSHDLDAISNMYETLKENPPMPRDAPPVAGRIVWVRHLLKMIEVPMTKFRQHAALMISRDSKAIIKKYNQIAQAFVEYEVLWEKAWQQVVHAARVSMNASVLVVHPDDGNLYVNFDLALLQVMREAKCMRPLGVRIPDLVSNMMNREGRLKSAAARFKFLINEFAILQDLIVPDLKNLFSLLLASLNEVLRPGLTTVTWNHINLEDYIQQLFDSMAKAREIVAKSRDLYDNRVVSNLSKICRMNLVRIPDNIVTTASFIAKQEERIRKGAFSLDQKCIEIESAVVDIIALVLKSHPEARDAEMIKQMGQEVLSTVWTKIYPAVLSSFNISFEKLKKRIRASFASGLLTLEQPFFKVEIELLPPQVKASPGIEDVQQAVNRTALAILRAMKITPWKSLTEESKTKLFDISDKVLGSIEVVRAVLTLTGSIESTRKKVQDHIEQFYEYEFLWTLDKQEQVNLFLETRPRLNQFIARLAKYEEMEREILCIPSITYVGPLCLSNDLVKFSLKAQVDAWKYAYTKELMKEAEKEVETTQAFVADMKKLLDCKVRDLDEVRTVSETLQQIVLLETEVEETLNQAEERCQVAKEFGYPTSIEDEQLFVTGRLDWQNLQKVAHRAAERLFRTQENFKTDLMRALVSFVEEVKVFYKDYMMNGPAFEHMDPVEGVKRLLKYQKLYEAKAKKLNAFQQGEDLFGLKRTEFPDLDKVRKSLHPLSQLYTLYTSCMKSTGDYHTILFSQLGHHVKKMKEELAIFTERVDNVPKELMQYEAYSKMRNTVRDTKDLLPIVDDLVNPSLRPRHWHEIIVVTQTVLEVESPKFCFQDLVDAHLIQHRSKIQSICLCADEEQVVEEKVEAIARDWHSAALTFKNFKSLGPVLIELSTLQLLTESFEEIRIVLQSLSASKHGLPFKESIDEHLHNFSAFMQLMEMWRGVQHVWWYVGVIFSSEDVSKQLPLESQRFHKVNKVYVDFMQQAFSLRYVPLLYEKCEEFRTILTGVSEDLEVCEKRLVGYLDSKRDSCPRLYYISDKVLLEALSQTSGLDSIQNGGVLSLFGNIRKLVLSPAHQSQEQWIESVQSDEAELLEFTTLVKEGSVEILLNDIEREMKLSLEALTWKAIKKMVPNLANLDIQSISSEYPCQACVLAVQYWLAHMCNAAFSVSGDMSEMQEVSRKVSVLGDQLALNLRGPLPRPIRAKLEALCIVNMMHQDIVRDLVQGCVKDKNSWDWQQHLKFSTDEQEHVYLETVLYKSAHTFEFMGCRKRLVCTAQTNKCYLFMMHAIASQQVACLTGPSGSGKSETILELGRMLGRFVLQFNCSAEVGYSSISNVVSGLMKSGTWVCFDDMSRLVPGLLSVMAQQLLLVLGYVRVGDNARKNSIETGDATAGGNLCKSTGIFCCSNLELATERARLPNSLRSCVRVLTVMEPDIQVVVHVTLTLASFTQAALIANKISCVYKTLAVVLSDKKRYILDFRNALAVANYMVKQQNHKKLPREEEQSLAARTIYGYNLPQFDICDIAVLELVLFDVLGYKRDENTHDNSKFYQGIFVENDFLTKKSKWTSEMNKQGLDEGADSLPSKINFVLKTMGWDGPIVTDKCMQAHELSTVRNGLTFLGNSFTGKTLSCRTLLQAMSIEGDVAIKALYINPVALGPKFLFGWYDSRSGDWTDGTFSALWRTAARNDALKTWVVLDGPINPMWIEYLNTSLDDFPMFTLANGDRIATKTGNKLVFEVDKLFAASPATISRTGIIHFPDKTIGHDALLTAWMRKRRVEESNMVAPLFEGLVGPIVEAVQRIPSSSSMQVNVAAQTVQFLNLLESFLTNSVIADDVPVRAVMEQVILVSLAWAFTGMLSFEDRKKIDEIFRSLTSNLPDTRKDSTLIDNILTDVEGVLVWSCAQNLCEWSYPTIEKGDDFINERVPKFIVPTQRSVTTSYISKWMVNQRIALMVAGARGVGKSTISSAVLESIRSKTKISSRITLSLHSTSHQFQVLSTMSFFVCGVHMSQTKCATNIQVLLHTVAHETDFADALHCAEHDRKMCAQTAGQLLWSHPWKVSLCFG